LSVNTELDEVIEVKAKILNKLGLKNGKMKLFSLKGGIELMDSDLMESLEGQEYLFYSLGEPFDY
jgi:hypothetical protein